MKAGESAAPVFSVQVSSALVHIMLMVVVTFFFLCSCTDPVKLPSSTCGQSVPFLISFLMTDAFVN